MLSPPWFCGYMCSLSQRINIVLIPCPPPPPCVPFLRSGACALGRSEQMGFKRQLSSAEIFEQAYHFSQELNARGERLSNVVRQRMILVSVSLLRGASVSAA